MVNVAYEIERLINIDENEENTNYSDGFVMLRVAWLWTDESRETNYWQVV